MSRQRVAAGNVERWLRGELALGALLGLSRDDRDELAWQAEMRLERGQVEDAERLFGLLEKLAPAGDLRGALGRGVCLQRRGALGEAERAYDEVLVLCPDDAFALTNRAEVRLLTGRAALARADLLAAKRRLEGKSDRQSTALRERIDRLFGHADESEAVEPHPGQTRVDELSVGLVPGGRTSVSSPAGVPGKMTAGGGLPRDRDKEGRLGWSDTEP